MARLNSHPAGTVIPAPSSVVHGICLSGTVGEAINVEDLGFRILDASVPVAGRLSSCIPRAGPGRSPAA